MEIYGYIYMRKRLLKIVSIVSLLGARHLGAVVKKASSLVVSLGKALDGTPPSLRGKHKRYMSTKYTLNILH